MAKQQITVDVLDGWEAVRYGAVRFGEHYQYGGFVERWDCVDDSIADYLVLRRVEPPLPRSGEHKRRKGAGRTTGASR